VRSFYTVLSVWSCEPKLYRCATAEIPALGVLGSKAQERLEISASGSRIHWPDGDIDLDLDAIREFADPRVRREAEFRYRTEASRYGAAIRHVREAHGLRQAAVSGLSEREVRRLENGEVQPHLETLKKLAKAHGVPLSEYMKTLATASKQYPSRSARKRRRAS
jgi:DNA-binding XRE family transcriptional regulator